MLDEAVALGQPPDVAAVARNGTLVGEVEGPVVGQTFARGGGVDLHTRGDGEAVPTRRRWTGGRGREADGREAVLLALASRLTQLTTGFTRVFDTVWTVLLTALSVALFIALFIARRMARPEFHEQVIVPGAVGEVVAKEDAGGGGGWRRRLGMADSIWTHAGWLAWRRGQGGEDCAGGCRTDVGPAECG